VADCVRRRQDNGAVFHPRRFGRRRDIARNHDQWGLCGRRM